ncbi:MAG: DNA-directed RNA polymerase subunit E'' [Methanosphaera sp. rholeuAM130]|jgi:DNA-directed RNA polymerase subunit E"|nr:transcription elongation factor subunit Spt4 [Methanosphaera sp.]RAP54234.1 MAG: DNA-directed RNA polymerase subunit E'' [Methanosphaera sp. rholeuAM130]
MAEKACPRCKIISFEDECPLCGYKTSNNWNGLIVILDPDNSGLAKELNITVPGRYALRVKEE